MEDQKQERTLAMLCHLSALAGYVGVPLGNILGPLLVWQIKKAESPLIDDQGKEALNFQITMMIAAMISGVLVFVLIGFVLLPVVIVADIVYTVIGGLKANEGVEYRYPFNIRFIK